MPLFLLSFLADITGMSEILSSFLLLIEWWYYHVDPKNINLILYSMIESFLARDELTSSLGFLFITFSTIAISLSANKRFKSSTKYWLIQYLKIFSIDFYTIKLII